MIFTISIAIVAVSAGFVIGWSEREAKFKERKECANPAHTINEDGEFQEGN